MVHPSDKKSLEQIFRINTSVWGGIFNPIIPVFSRPPECWKNDHKTDRSYGATRGYLRYFEPDVFVEAEEGLAEKVGLPSEFAERYRQRVVSLDNFWDNKKWGGEGPRLGISVSEVLNHLYNTERKFVLREDHREHFHTYSGSEHPLAALTLFGGYPDEGSAQYLKRDFEHVFKPASIDNFEAAWKKRIFEQNISELSLTAEGLKPSHFGVNRPTFFLFDPTSPHDLIDYWNLRAQALGRVHPIPISYWGKFRTELENLAEKYFQPATEGRFARGTTLELARSIYSEEMVQTFQDEITKSTNNLFSLKPWRDRVWEGHSSGRSSVGTEVSRPYADEKTQILENDKDKYLRLATLTPKFADSFHRNDYSWINVLSISDSHHHAGMTTTLPFNVANNLNWRVNLGGKVIVNSEGWCLPQRYSSSGELLEKLSAFDCFDEFFKKAGFSTRQSEAGMVTQQMFSSLSNEASGLHAVGIFATAERLKFFNKYAMGQRVRSKGAEIKEESFPTRSISLNDIDTLVRQHGKDGMTRKSLLSRFIAYNIVQLGIEVKCPHCFSQNWFDLDTVRYSLTCELCRKDFDFPQEQIEKRSENWKYRLIGPFAAPDFARGSYSALLTARLLNELSGHDDQLTFCPGIEFSSKVAKHEADLVCWLREQGRFDVRRDPKLIFAECKSFAAEALKPIDFRRMAALSKNFPDAAIVFSVLKDTFSDSERTLAKAYLTKHAGKLNYGRYDTSVAFLTGSDLFFDYSLNGGDDERYSYHDCETISDFASASQRLNLGLHE